MDLDLDMDLALDGPSKAPPKPSKFQPRSSKFKPKPKQESESLPIPKPESSSLPQPKTESQPVSDSPLLQKKEDSLPAPSPSLLSAPQADEGIKEEDPMDVDGSIEEEEDRVVREIDVFFTPPPISDNAQLYVMQYPLRPCWRPYENFHEVRVKPKQSKLEVDLQINFEKENYEHDVSERLKIEKQTLSSSKAPFITGYAVGMLRGSKLHLSPVHAVVQFRPSMAYLNEGKGSREKSTINGNMEAAASSTEGKLAKATSNADDAESWISLEYHGANSSISTRYRQKMMTEESRDIHFSMNSYDYACSLCPGSSNNSNGSKGPSKRSLLLLPLEERFKNWFSEGPEIHRFDALMHLAPDNSEEEVLEVLKQHSDLVQGLWVAKSKLRCGGVGVQALARDYVLLLFNKCQLIPHKQLKSVKVPYEILKRVLLPLAIERSSLGDWKFKEPTDKLFKKGHPYIVEEQEREWLIREKYIMDAVHGGGRSAPVKSSLKPSATNGPTNAVRSVKGGIEDTLSSRTPTTMSKETREALPKALEELFNVHKVCSLQLICQGLRDMAVSKSSLPKGDPKAAVAAALGASAPLAELQSVIKQIATEIHGIYVMKPQGSSDVDKLRRIVIDLFTAREPNAKLKKADIVEAAKIVLKRDITNQEYNKVVNEFCVSNRGGSWMLRSGDGTLK